MLPPNVQHLEAEAAFVVLARAQELESQGRSIINLGIGQPDFSPPPHVVAAANQALLEGHHGYTTAPGTIECRRSVSNHVRKQYQVEINPNQILITPGGKVTMSFACMLLGTKDEANDGAKDTEILIPDPGFPTYAVMSAFSGAKVVRYRLNPENGFSLCAEDVAKNLSHRTRLLILNAPGNPTGGSHDPAELRKLLEILRNYPNTYILSDEIYSRLCFDAPFRSMLQEPEIHDRLIVLDGWSKSFAMTGWRLGWSVWPTSLIEHVTNLAIHTYGCVNAAAQIAGAAALAGDQFPVEAMKGHFAARRDLVMDQLNAIDGIYCPRPSGAFYAYPNVGALGVSGDQAQQELLEDYGVATISGSSFGLSTGDHIRLSFAASEDKLTQGLSRIAQWAQTRRVQKSNVNGDNLSEQNLT